MMGDEPKTNSRNPEFHKLVGRGGRIKWVLSKDWKIVFDDTWREIMREASKESGFPYEDVERINIAWWKYFAEMLRRVELPVIRLAYLCTVRPSKQMLYNYCENMTYRLDRLSQGSGEVNGKKVDISKMQAHLNRLHDTYFRIDEELKELKRRRLAHKMRMIAEGKYKKPFVKQKNL